MAKLVLWTSTMTSGSIAHAVLAEAGATFEVRYLGLRAGEHKQPAFLAVNPKGQVPALQVDDRVVITENPAVGQYVAETHPASGLLPADPLEKAQALSWLAWWHYGAAESFMPAFTGPRFTTDPSDAAGRAVKEAALRRIDAALAFLDKALAGQDFIMGAQRTLPDIPIAFTTRWATMLGVSLPTRVEAHRARVLVLPGVARVLAEEGARG